MFDAQPFSYPWFAGIARYTARLSLALGARVPVRFFDGGRRAAARRGTSTGRRTRISRTGDAGSGRVGGDRSGRPRRIASACTARRTSRSGSFPTRSASCTTSAPWSCPGRSRKRPGTHFGKFLTETLLASDVVLSVSHSTKADAAWFSSLDPERIVVAPSGPSLCVESHRHRGRVARTDRIGLVVSTIEPRKNAVFLFDWFQKTTLLPPDLELWWVGKLGWLTSRDELERMANPAGGRRVRFLGKVSDAELCRLYQTAGWSIYPSLYEGFGFPILDSLRHGTPVLSSCTSSMGELDHPGVFFFDPQDPATVDVAWRRLRGGQAGLDPAGPAGRTLQLGPRGPGRLLGAHTRKRRRGRCQPSLGPTA